MKKIIVCLALGTFYLANSLHAHNLADVIETTLPSIAYIEVERFTMQRSINVETQTMTEETIPDAPAVGTGFIVDGNKVITNYHVIAYATQQQTNVYIFLSNGERYLAEIMGYDEITDVAVLVIPGEHPSLRFASDAQIRDLRAGDEVFTISNFFGIRFSSTTGIISSNRRADNRWPHLRVLQLQILQGSGSSGGPILNEDGLVIGINEQVLSMSPDTQRSGILSSVAFGIRGDLVKKAIANILRNGVILTPDLGHTIISYGPTSEQFRYYPVADGDGHTGLLVIFKDASNTNTPFLPRDIILSVNDQVFDSASLFFTWLVDNHQPGEEIKLQVYRGGEVINIVVELRVGSRTF